jgi:phosphatidate cytidylyltransferase
MRANVSRVWADTPRRLLTAAIGGPLALLIVYLGFPVYHGFGLLIGVLIGVELHGVIKAGSLWGLFIAQLLILSGILAGTFNNYLILGAAIGVSLVVILLVGQPATYRRYVYLLVAALYIGFPLGLLALVRDMPQGLWWTYVLFASNWGTDSMALVGGRVWGRTKLAPKISPNKTVEGAVVGFVSGTLAGIILSQLMGLPLTTALIVCPMVSILTIAGDLIESGAKRQFGVKDTGSILPGHGGFIDRVDGLVLAAPFFYMALLTLPVS